MKRAKHPFLEHLRAGSFGMYYVRYQKAGPRSSRDHFAGPFPLLNQARAEARRAAAISGRPATVLQVKEIFRRYTA